MPRNLSKVIAYGVEAGIAPRAPIKPDLAQRGLFGALGASLAAFCGGAFVFAQGEQEFLPFVVCLGLTAGFSAVTYFRLRPLARSARALRSGADTDSFDDVDFIARRLEAAATMSAASGQKSGAQEHTGYSYQQLLNAIAADVKDGAVSGVLATVKWADYGRVAAFDPETAETLLNAFANRLQSIVAKDRVLVQSGHNSFNIWLAGSAAQAAAELRAIKYAMSADLEAGESKLAPSVDLMGAFYPEDGADPEALLRRARAAPLKFEQVDGELRLRPALPPTVLSNDFAVEQHLKRAIERNELELHYQPVIDAAKSELVGAEALLRWTSPTLGSVSPVRFIPVMERIGLADEIGTWVLNEACRQASIWRREGFNGLKIAINVSHKQIAQPQFEKAIAGTLQRYNVDPSLLELELTETAATHDLNRAKEFFAQMAALGVSIAIDDFGTGYSSLSYLKQLRFNKLKIDREFVTAVHARPDSRAICQSLVALARGLGIEVLAEGAEERAEVDCLKNLGCPLFQGYYFAKPLPAEKFLDFACSGDWLEKLGPDIGPSEQGKRRIA